ncbi:Hypothetical protein SCLAV_2262 [Streptomyces clavuligerus]|uniref:Uncharacterized protein n=1 Tax=Streptomyces clavuligerus TaxID=1901 RepID=B5GPT5_STRCL|nr:hypothetical protein SSCG_01219 [Streptomyces clavuligerus]EFG07335.1 Hypothetical protein SCLAV_2262 [Streptomyces clavuligerus]
MRLGDKHWWGAVVCCRCTGRMPVFCTPRDAGDHAKRIDEFIKDHIRCA